MKKPWVRTKIPTVYYLFGKKKEFRKFVIYWQTLKLVYPTSNVVRTVGRSKMHEIVLVAKRKILFLRLFWYSVLLFNGRYRNITVYFAKVYCWTYINSDDMRRRLFLSRNQTSNGTMKTKSDYAFLFKYHLRTKKTLSWSHFHKGQKRDCCLRNDLLTKQMLRLWWVCDALFSFFFM